MLGRGAGVDRISVYSETASSMKLSFIRLPGPGMGTLLVVLISQGR